MQKSKKEIIESVIERLKDKTKFGGYIGGNTTAWAVEQLELLLAGAGAEEEARAAQDQAGSPAQAEEGGEEGGEEKVSG